MIMQFGKYKGKHISELPSQYLHWVLENVPTLNEKDIEAIKRHLTNNWTHSPNNPCGVDLEQLEKIMNG